MPKLLKHWTDRMSWGNFVQVQCSGRAVALTGVVAWRYILPVSPFFSLALCATLVVAFVTAPHSERPDRGTQLHETEEALVTQPHQDPTLSQEREILGGFCPAGEAGVLGYGDTFVRCRQRLLRRKATRLRSRPCGNRFRVIEFTCRLFCVHVGAYPFTGFT